MSRERCQACYGSGHGTGAAPCWSCSGRGFRETDVTALDDELSDDQTSGNGRHAAQRGAGGIVYDEGPRVVDGLPGGDKRPHPFFELVYSAVFWAALSGAIVVIALAIHGKFAAAGFFIAVFNCILAGLALGTVFGLFEPLLGLTKLDGFFDLSKRLGFTLTLVGVGVGVGVAVALQSALQYEMFLWSLDWDLGREAWDPA